MRASSWSAGENGGAGEGEMATRVREFPWETTPLGPQADWSPALRMACDLCLGSRFPIALWWGDDLTFLYNDAYRHSLGASKHPGALGRSGREVWAEIWEVVEPSFAAVLAGGPATWEVDQQLFVHRNGYLEEAYFTYGVSPIREPDGRFGGFLNAVTESTQRALVERRLNTVRELAAGTVGALTAAGAYERAAAVLAGATADIPFALLYSLTAEGARLAGAAGLPPDTVTSPAVIDLATPDDERGWAAPLARVVASGQGEVVTDLEARFGPGVFPGGAWAEAPRGAVLLPLLADGAGMRGIGVLIAGISPRRALDEPYRGFFDLVAGQIAGAIAVAAGREAERSHAEELATLARSEQAARAEAEEAVRARDQFLSIASHELRNPLAGLTGNLQLLQRRQERGTLTPEGLIRQIASLREAGERLTRLTDDLLDVSRLRTGQLPLRSRVLDLAELVRAAVEQAQFGTTRHRLTVENSCPDERCQVQGDPDRLGQVITNLLENAVKYSPEGGAVRIALGPYNGGARLCVRDEGIGLPTGSQDRIFEPFGRAPNARERNLPGMGLGLYVSRRIIEAHGGTLTVESLGDGRGTTFVLWVPGSGES
ncbi:MAG TPA: HAMP domain-containing sensor histidine kinase [Thermomicrobiales bacterium]